MPCWQCARRQTDPARGPSPWRRGVLGGEQVLVCPDCSSEPDWDANLDACARCGSRRLVKALGEVSCRACGAAGERGDLVWTAAGDAIRSGGSAGGGGPVVGAAIGAAGGAATVATAAPSRDEGLARAVEEALRRRRQA